MLRAKKKSLLDFRKKTNPGGFGQRNNSKNMRIHTNEHELESLFLKT
jgi:hypothetical protein